MITPIDKTENVRFYTEKCGFAIHSEEMDGKWIVSLSGETIPAEDILETIGFQEQYFMGELYTL